MKTNTIFNEIFPSKIIAEGYNRHLLLKSSIVPIIFSTLCMCVFGTKAVLIPIPILLIYFTLKYDNFLLYFYLMTLPIIIYNFPNISVAYNYSLVLMIITLWLIRHILNPVVKIEYSIPILVFVFVLLIIASASALNNGLFRREIYGLVKTIIFFGLVFVIYDIYKLKHSTAFFISLSIPILASSFYLFSVFTSITSIIGLLELYRLKPAGFFENSNTFAGAILCVLPFWISLVIWHRNTWIKFISSIPTIFLFIALFLTNSRAAFVGLFVVIILFSYWAGKLKYILIALLLLSIILILVPDLYTIGSLALRVERGGSNRLDIWYNTIDMIKSNIWLGIGMSNYRFEYNKYFTTAAERRFVGFFPHAHNQILQTTVQFGFMGFILIVALHYYLIKISSRLLKEISEQYRYLAYAVIGGIVGTLFRSIFEADGMLLVGEIYPNIIFWMLLILLIKLNKASKLELFGQYAKSR